MTTYGRAGACPAPATRRRRARCGAPYRPYLEARWAAGCRDAMAVCRALQAQGFRSGRVIGRAAVAGWRTEARRRGPYAPGEPGQAPPMDAPVGRPLSPRPARWRRLREDADLAPAQRASRPVRRRACPPITHGQALVAACGRLVRAREAAALGPGLAAATTSGLADRQRFAAGIERARAAVANALEQPWSNGPGAGQITRLTSVTRSM